MKDTGGHAFPHQLDIPNEDGINIRHRSRGMTLRDYFAAKAMQAYINRPEATQVQDRMIAECAYDMADAMIQERSKT
jgi:hypothetical protein